MNRVRVTICDRDYYIRSEESAAYYHALSKKVDAAINEMLLSGGGISFQSAAALAALSAFDEAQKANDSMDNIRTQIKEYVDDAGKARAERDEALRNEKTQKDRAEELEKQLSAKSEQLEKLKNAKPEVSPAAKDDKALLEKLEDLERQLVIKSDQLERLKGVKADRDESAKNEKILLAKVSELERQLSDFKSSQEPQLSFDQQSNRAKVKAARV